MHDSLFCLHHGHGIGRYLTTHRLRLTQSTATGRLQLFFITSHELRRIYISFLGIEWSKSILLWIHVLLIWRNVYIYIYIYASGEWIYIESRMQLAWVGIAMETKVYSLLPSLNLKSRVKLAESSNLSSFGFRPCPRALASSSTVESEREKEKGKEKEKEKEKEGLGCDSRPVYVATPPNRQLRTPHSG